MNFTNSSFICISLDMSAKNRKDEKVVKMSFTLPPATVEKLKELSQKTSLKMSSIVNLGILNFDK